MIDVLLIDTDKGVDIATDGNGRLRFTHGIESAAILSVDGGNDEDRAIEATEAVQWWGNRILKGEAAKYRSRLQGTLDSRPLVSANLQLAQESAETDLAWLEEQGHVSEVEATASIKGPKRLGLEILTPTTTISFAREWR